MNHYTEEQITKAKAYSDLIQKCWDDAAFKEELIQNPKMVEDHLDVEIPTGKELVIVDHSNGGTFDRDNLDTDTAYFVIPEQVDLDSIELNDEQLELIAAGAPTPSPASPASTTICGAAVIVGFVFAVWAGWD